MGDDHHGDDDHGEDDHGDDHGHAAPHAPRLAINLTLLIITAGAIAAIFLKGWAGEVVADSTAAGGVPAHHPDAAISEDPHQWMPYVASGVTLIGILIAWWLHLANRSAADTIKNAMLANPAIGWLPRAMERKWYVDELYDVILRFPLWVVGHALSFFDRYFVDLIIVDGVGRAPRWLGKAFQPFANGVLHSYAVWMAGGLGVIILLVLYLQDIVALLASMTGGAG
jgi:NADH:ubiquinone oxidoreductase subunit 5 (subunit L)/multisubunit Na+/H+ antiporter MnhA subunit